MIHGLYFVDMGMIYGELSLSNGELMVDTWGDICRNHGSGGSG